MLKHCLFRMRRNPSRYKVPITINRVSIQARFLESRVKCIFESLGSTTFAVHCRQGVVRSRLFILAVSNFCGWRWLNPIFRSNSYNWLLIGQGHLSQGQKKAPQSEVSLCCFALSSVIFHDPSPSHFIALHLLVPVELLLPVRMYSETRSTYMRVVAGARFDQRKWRATSRAKYGLLP
jgi:hypothetical protein